jgi:hypothetical protein
MNDVVTPKSRGPKAPPKKESLARLQHAPSEAQRLGIVILEVLAGGCTPAEAATRLSISLPRYYQLEARAVEGLVRACQPLPLGKQPSPDTRLAALEKQLRQVQRECARQQALVRTTQRSAGVSLPVKPTPVKPPAKPDRTGRKKRRPTVRALKAVAILQNQLAAEVAAAIQPDVSAQPSAAAPTPRVEV